jgi:hypothetical protein
VVYRELESDGRGATGVEGAFRLFASLVFLHIDCCYPKRVVVGRRTVKDDDGLEVAAPDCTDLGEVSYHLQEYARTGRRRVITLTGPRKRRSPASASGDRVTAVVC